MRTLKNLLCVVALSATMMAQAQTQVIAHRGFWNCEGSAQNSITGLKKAAQEKVYGAEFDIQLTADKVIVVNHDHIIQGYEIAKTPFKVLKKLRLKNGERLSTLDQYLKEGKKHPNLQLILESKPLSSKENEDFMAQEVVKMVKKYGLEKQVEYISFSLNLCEQYKQLSPNSENVYLGGNLSPKEIKAKGFTGIDYHYGVFYKHLNWVKEAHELGLKVNTWTVNGATDMLKCKRLDVDYITTDHPLLAKEILLED